MKRVIELLVMFVFLLGCSDTQPKEVIKKKEKVEVVDSTIVGYWVCEKSLNGAELILRDLGDDAFQMETVFSKESSMVDDISISQMESHTRYDDGNSFGEYYLVEDNGNLGMYGKDGKFDEAKKK